MENGFALSSWGGFVYKSLQVSVGIQPLFLPEKVEPKVQAWQMLAYPSKPTHKGKVQVREMHLVSIFGRVLSSLLPGSKIICFESFA